MVSKADPSTRTYHNVMQRSDSLKGMQKAAQAKGDASVPVLGMPGCINRVSAILICRTLVHDGKGYKSCHKVNVFTTRKPEWVCPVLLVHLGHAR
jgi:hypothetical protein